MSDQTEAYRNPPSHADILHAIHELARNVRTNGRKLDILIDHLGADFSREDAAVQADREAIADASQNLPPGQQPTKG